MGKGAKNRATARRTASEKDAGKWTDSVGSPSPQSPRVFFTCFTQFAPSPLSERLEQAIWGRFGTGPERIQNWNCFFAGLILHPFGSVPDRFQNGPV